MRQLFHWTLAILIISSCSSHKDDSTTSATTNKQNAIEVNNVLNNSKATIDEIISFFEVKKNPNKPIQLMFFKENESEPMRWISVDENELERSILIEQKNFSVLLLNNPAESSVALFYKKNGERVDKIIEDRHYSDSVIFYKMNDTLLICQYYCEYDFGSDLSDIRTYYFIGEKTGFFKYGCSTVGEKLKFENFVLKEEDTRDNQHDARILISTDTVKQLGAINDEIAFEISYTYFDKVIFSDSDKVSK